MGAKRAFLIIGLFILFSNMVYAAKLIPYLINPSSSINVTQNEFFNFTVGVRCEGGDCGNVTAILDPEAYYEPSIGSPYCPTGESPCIAGSELLRSVDTASDNGPPYINEPNQPNTIDNCTDGTWNVYQADESIENITLSGLVTNSFVGGHLILVKSWVFCVGQDDNIYIAYNNGSGFQFKNKFSCPGWGFNLVYMPPFGLDNVEGNHTIRIINKYIWGTQVTCGTYKFDDNDDLTFYVSSGKGIIPMNSGTPFYTTTQNPVYPENITVSDCLQNMKSGDSCNITWQVNATGDINSTWDFFTIYQSDDANVASNETEKVAVTIVEERAEEPPVEEPIKFNITLNQGWNLVSFPLNLTGKLV
ncbi:MAG: hypothetical protein KKC54_04650, partial [Nanoarchaeota archaeon]|nr:hypothetical protein [Nanoarchaeota archaeon]